MTALVDGDAVPRSSRRLTALRARARDGVWYGHARCPVLVVVACACGSPAARAPGPVAPADAPAVVAPAAAPVVVAPPAPTAPPAPPPIPEAPPWPASVSRPHVTQALAQARAAARFVAGLDVARFRARPGRESLQGMIVLGVMQPASCAA
jgi:hypothetical protein